MKEIIEIAVVIEITMFFGFMATILTLQDICEEIKRWNDKRQSEAA